MLTRRYLLGSLAALSLPSLTPSAAEPWPTKPVRMIYPYAAGSSVDGAARLFAHRLREVFGQPFVVENRTGANGTLAVEAVARAPADGHTLLWAPSPPITIVPAMTKVSYDAVKDFSPISAATTSTFALIVNKRFPAETVSEFVSYVRAQPDKLVYADAGAGSTPHLSMELFLNRAGLRVTNVSYRGAAPALTDVVAGHVPMMFALLADALPHATAGNIRVLAVSSNTHSQQAPNIPTISESGFPGFETGAWSGVLAPTGTPQEIVHRIAAEISLALKDAVFTEQLVRLGVEPLGNGPEQFAAMIAAEIPLWAEAVKIAGLKPR